MSSNESCTFYELYKSAERALKTKRGSFYPNKNFGSNITAEMKRRELYSTAVAALAELDGVNVYDVCLEGDYTAIELLINGKIKEVRLFI